MKKWSSLAALVLFCAISARAQNISSVTASAIHGSGGSTLLASGTLVLQATDQNNNIIAFQVGGGGSTVTTPYNCAIVNGAISGCSVANPANTTPANIRYHITILQGARKIFDSPGAYLCNQAGACTTPFSFNFDTCFSSGACGASPIPVATGPAGPPGAGCSSTVAYSSGTTYSIGQCVISSGIIYISIVNSNLGNTPASSPTDWSGLAALGANNIFTGTTTLSLAGGNTISLLNAQANAAPITGNSGTQTFYTYTVPANTVGTLKGLRVTVGWNHSGSASVTYLLSLNGTSVYNFGSSTNLSMSAIILNTGSTTGTVTASSLGGSQISTLPGLSWASPQILTATFNVANTDTVTPIQWVVEMVQ